MKVMSHLAFRKAGSSSESHQKISKASSQRVTSLFGLVALQHKAAQAVVLLQRCTEAADTCGPQLVAS